jgi:hypothetical protein
MARVARAHGTRRNPVPQRYVWPKARAKVQYGYVYERDGEQRIFGLSSLDLAPNEAMLDMGWRAIFKVRVARKGEG